MFSKSKVTETPKPEPTKSGPSKMPTTPATDFKEPTPKAKPPASLLSSDLHITGNIRSSGDIQVEGQIDGDIRAHLLTVGENATIKGEVTADDIVVNGRVVGRVRGLKVRLAATAKVEGDIIHKTIAIESGAHFEGSVQRQDDPMSAKSTGSGKPVSSPSSGKS